MDILTDTLGRVYVSADGKALVGKPLYSSGSFIGTTANPITITHNLGCKSVAVLCQAVDADGNVIQSSDSPYRTTTFGVCHIDNFPMQLQKYQKQDGWATISTDFAAHYKCFGIRHYFPVAEAAAAMNNATLMCSDAVISENALTIKLSYRLLIDVKYIWHAYAIPGAEIGG